MNSFSFPKMFNQTTANLVYDKAAVRSNLLLLLSSEAETLFGDPYFGCQLKKYMFEQSSSIIPDLLIDHLYTAITTFIPQVFLTRKNIKVFTIKTTIYAEVSYIFAMDNTSDLFTIKLTDSAEEES